MEIFQQDGLFGLKNDCGEAVICPQYIEFYHFSCGVACVRDINYHYAYINENGIPVVPFGKFVWIDTYFSCGYARVKGYSKSLDKECWGIINTVGVFVIPLEYDRIWPINEKYIDNIIAYKNDEECRINLREADRWIVFDDLKYIRTYTTDEFKSEFNVDKIYVRVNPRRNCLSFYYGTNVGVVSDDDCMSNPVISIVCNSAGKVFSLLHNKNNIGRKRIKQVICKDSSSAGSTSKT